MRHTALLGLLGLALLGCEPLDPGGGGGVGGRLAFIRNGSLVVSFDDGNGERTLTDENTSATPALSPSGNTVAFAFSETGNDLGRSIQLVDFAAGSLRETLVVPEAGETFSSPAWSPDGTEIVFVVTSGPDVSLRRISASGGTAEEITGSQDAQFPAFLDASTLVVLGPGLELLELPLSGGTPISLGITTPSRPAVAPGGGQLAWSQQDATGGTIFVRDLLTGADTPLASTGGGDVKPAFSFDGSLVAFESGGLIYAAPADGTGSAQLLQSGTDVSWAP